VDKIIGYENIESIATPPAPPLPPGVLQKFEALEEQWAATRISHPQGAPGKLEKLKATK
jgi:hypothetical protein